MYQEWHTTSSIGDEHRALAARSNGTVKVYKNGTLVGSRDVSSWSLYASSVQIGFTVNGGTTTKLDNFGGGTYTGYLPPQTDSAFRTVAYSSPRASEANTPAIVVTPPANQTWKKYYYLGGRRIALRIVRNGQADEVNYLHGDHLGSTSLTTNASGVRVADARYLPFGGNRPGYSNNLPTDYRFTGQRQDANIGLYDYGARFYDPLLGRFISADSIVPGAGNPQVLNRYSYVFNSPLKYIDPSGYDPLDAEWRRAFRERHGYDPDEVDELIRLFSYAYPDEWDYNLFYNADGTRSIVTPYVFAHPSNSRSWDTMPDALVRLSKMYTADEKAAFVRDVGSLYAGLRLRSQDGLLAPPHWYQGAVLPVHLYIKAGSIDPLLIQSTTNRQNDPDANVHHWAWTFAMGFDMGADFASAVNEIHERQGPFGLPINQNMDQSDVAIGWRGAQMGGVFRATTVSYSDLPGLFKTWMGIGR